MKFQNSGGEFFKVQVPIGTVATTGNTDAVVQVPYAGKLIDQEVSFTDALTTDDTNYSTFSLTNLNNSNAAMLATSPAGVNTTKATGGAALTANAKRTLTPTTTTANLACSKGDRIRFRAAASGTLGNTLTQGVLTLTFQRTA